MRSLNKVQLIGNLGSDPEIRSFTSGDKVANFSVATSESWNDKTTGEVKEKTQWHNICVFGKLAEIVEKYVKKGDKVYIEGALETRSYDKDGSTKYVTEVILRGFGSTLLMLSNKNETPTPVQNAKVPDNPPVDPLEDDIPF